MGKQVDYLMWSLFCSTVHLIFFGFSLRRRQIYLFSMHFINFCIALVEGVTFRLGDLLLVLLPSCTICTFQSYRHSQRSPWPLFIACEKASKNHLASKAWITCAYRFARRRWMAAISASPELVRTDLGVGALHWVVLFYARSLVLRVYFNF